MKVLDFVPLQFVRKRTQIVYYRENVLKQFQEITSAL